MSKISKDFKQSQMKYLELCVFSLWTCYNKKGSCGWPQNKYSLNSVYLMVQRDPYLFLLAQSPQSFLMNVLNGGSSYKHLSFKRRKAGICQLKKKSTQAFLWFSTVTVLFFQQEGITNTLPVTAVCFTVQRSCTSINVLVKQNTIIHSLKTGVW